MTTVSRRTVCEGALLASVGTVLAACAASPTITAAATSPKPRATRVVTPDGVGINVQEFGNPAGIEVLFIHGFMQSHLSWVKQLHDPALARDLRMVAYDFRGHGASDKPMAAEYYNDGGRFADELKAVIAGAGLKRPILVGWSYGTRILSDYLVKYGDVGIAGIDFVGGAGNGDPKHVGPGGALIGKTFTEDLAENIRATADFIRICFSRQPTAAEFETMMAFNMVVPPKVRGWLRRPAPYEAALKAVKVPAIVTHGVEDKVLGIGLGRYLVQTVPGAKASFYDGVGHSPFWEDTPRFNAELLAFARSTVR